MAVGCDLVIVVLLEVDMNRIKYHHIVLILQHLGATVKIPSIHNLLIHHSV